jgi:hypothetical protein
MSDSQPYGPSKHFQIWPQFPLSAYAHEVWGVFGVQLMHLTYDYVLLLALFVHLCEYTWQCYLSGDFLLYIFLSFRKILHQ